MRQQGFTLIELMVVVAIVAILAAIAISQYNQHYNADVQLGTDGGVLAYTKPQTLVCTTNLSNVETREPAIPGARWEFVGGVFVTADANGNPVTRPAGNCHIES